MKSKVSIYLYLFIITMYLPISIYLGSIRLSPYRAILILLLVPSFFKLINGKAGKLLPTDWFIIFYALYGAAALFATTDLDAVMEPAGIFIIESLGAYLIGRTLVRDEQGFRAMSKFLFYSILLLLPFALIETLTNRALILEVLRPFFNVAPKGFISPRFGLHRAQVVFEHPILYGAYVASSFGIIYYIASQSARVPLINFKAIIVAFAGVLSVSSGVISSLMVQIILILWDRNTKSIKSRWKIFGAILVSFYFIIDLISNRSPFHVIVSYLTFSAGSAYNRILIWNYGTAEVWRHPIFGIGFGEWERPSWMSGSMDNFWLVTAVRHGLPAFIFIAGAVVFLLRDIGRLTLPTPQLNNCRSGWFVSLGGMIVAGATVDYWNAIYVWFMFMLGAGMWLMNSADAVASNSEASSEMVEVNNKTRRNPYARRRSEDQ